MFKILTLLLLLTVVNCQVYKRSELKTLIETLFPKAHLDVSEGPLVAKTTPSILVSTTNSNHDGEEDLSCFMADGTIGQCVNYYLCDGNNTTSIINDRSAIENISIIDIRAGEGSCASYLDVCCLPREVHPPNNPIKPQLQPPREGCGWGNVEGAGMSTIRVTDGETKFREFPWVVAILNEPKNRHIGAGSLIALNVVLTAAHTVDQSGAQRIRAGEWDTMTMKEVYPYQDRNVASLEIHPYFDTRYLHYNVALLFLSESVTPAPNVGVVCLPPPRMITFAGTPCFTTGWSKYWFDEDDLNKPTLRKVEVPVVERHACQTALRRTRLGRFFQLHTSFMCAGDEKGKNICKGDGGSPLSCPIMYEEGRYMQSGIAAWDIGCGEDGLPGVFVDLSLMREWIDDQMVSRGLDTRSYTI